MRTHRIGLSSIDARAGTTNRRWDYPSWLTPIDTSSLSFRSLGLGFSQITCVGKQMSGPDGQQPAAGKPGSHDDEGLRENPEGA